MRKKRKTFRIALIVIFVTANFLVRTEIKSGNLALLIVGSQFFFSFCCWRVKPVTTFSFPKIHLRSPQPPRPPSLPPNYLHNILTYRKFRKISPGAYIFQRPILRGLFLEGLIFGGAHLRREICVSKSIGIAL